MVYWRLSRFPGVWKSRFCTPLSLVNVDQLASLLPLFWFLTFGASGTNMLVVFFISLKFCLLLWRHYTREVLYHVYLSVVRVHLRWTLVVSIWVRKPSVKPFHVVILGLVINDIDMFFLPFYLNNVIYVTIASLVIVSLDWVKAVSCAPITFTVIFSLKLIAILWY